MLVLSCLLAGCGSSPALSLRPLYQASEKPAAEPRLEGNWAPVALSSTGLNQEDERWAVSAQSDGCYQAERRKKDSKKPDQEENEIYRVCLVSWNDRLFFDQQLQRKTIGQQTSSAKDLTPEMAALHMVGRLWPETDLIRITRLQSDWIRESEPEELRATIEKSMLFTGSTAQLREIMAQHSEDAKAMGKAWYFCRPDADCSRRVVEDELAREPDDKDVLTGSAVFYAGVEDYDKAITLMDKAAQVAPQDERALTRMYVGVARLLRRDFSGARNEFAASQKLTEETEIQEDAACWIGISHFLEGRYAEAHKAFAAIMRPPDDNWAMVVILDYASLVRMGRGKQAESFLSAQNFERDEVQRLLLQRSAGEVKDFVPANFTDDELLRGDGVFYALVRTAKGDRMAARDALERTVSKTPKWDPVYVGAKIELERLDALPAASK
jgi:Flp pilus assembly protein TadD